MGLSGRELKELQEALVDAFPTTASLEQMLALELNKNLGTIAGEGSLQDIVFRLTNTAKAQGWVEDLICEACNHNPGNPELKRIIQNLIIKNSSTLDNRIEELLREYGYSELNKLGSGAINIIYRSIRKKDQKPIVIETIKNEFLYRIIKSVNQDLKELDDAIRNFTTEAENLSSLEHPHIVSYCDHLTINYKFLINNPDKNTDNKPYLLRHLNLIFLFMEDIDGQSLEQLLSRRDTPLEDKEALRYIQQIGEALTFVHDKGVLHGDIKPQNIMVRKTTNDAVLIDFGIAREFNSKVTQTPTVGFTQAYAPPEQLQQSSKWGNYTDVYGLAATLYYLLTRKHPTHAMLRKSDSSSFVEPKRINSNISDTINEAILWGMELEPSKRPQTVQQWLEKLLLKETHVELKLPQEVPTESFISEPAPAEQQRREHLFILCPHCKFKNLDTYKFCQKCGTFLVDLDNQRRLGKLQEQEQRKLSPPISNSDYDLSSEKNVDYTRLRNLLAAGNWKQADEETLAVMLKATGREKEGWLNIKSIEKFPCTDLRTIDQLWVKYSNGRFGFSVQKLIWKGVGHNYEKFGDHVGWRMNKSWIELDEVTYGSSAQEGHLPLLIRFAFRGSPWEWWLRLDSFFSRTQACKL